MGSHCANTPCPPTPPPTHTPPGRQPPTPPRWGDDPASPQQGRVAREGKGKGKVLGRSPNSSVSVIPTCPKAQHATSYYTHQNSCNSGTVNSRET